MLTVPAGLGSAAGAGMYLLRGTALTGVGKLASRKIALGLIQQSAKVGTRISAAEVGLRAMTLETGGSMGKFKGATVGLGLSLVPGAAMYKVSVTPGSAVLQVPGRFMGDSEALLRMGTAYGAGAAYSGYSGYQLMGR